MTGFSDLKDLSLRVFNIRNMSPEQLKDKKKFDVILNLEIVEHVEDVNLYISAPKH